MSSLEKKSCILCINVGSSNIKFALFKINNDMVVLLRTLKTKRDEKIAFYDLQAFIGDDFKSIKIVSHRFVLLDPKIQTPCIVSSFELIAIENSISLAPLHNPLSIYFVKTCLSYFGSFVVQSLHSDTDFYNDLPSSASDCSIPKMILDKYNLSKRGFHGLAHRSMLESLQKNSEDTNFYSNIISLQLGSGCSICAIKNNVPIDISMGYSTLGGLIMSTRHGNIDPGIIFKLHCEGGLSIEEIESTLTQKSGLLGLSGISGDIKKLIQNDTYESKNAIDTFCINIKKHIGAYIALLGGLDCIVIGGGIGENSSFIRNEILKNLACFDLLIDINKNDLPQSNFNSIHSTKSLVKIYVIKVDEEKIMAKEARTLITLPYEIRENL
jgi:acetate kinase